MSRDQGLIAARIEAINRGDKALGREIYHQLINMGLSADEINAPGALKDELASAKSHGKSAAPDPETATAQAPEDTAAPRAKRTR